MAVDLNRFVFDANPPAPTSRHGAEVRRLSSAMPQTQDIRYRIGQAANDTRGFQQVSSYNRPDMVFTTSGFKQGNFKKTVDGGLVTNISFTQSDNSPLAANAVFPHSDDGWDVLENLMGSIEGPSDWASQHDYYLHGTPKRQ